VVLSPATFHPDEAWVVTQAERFVEQAREQKLPVSTLQRDRDSKFTAAVDKALRSKRVKVKVNQFRSPNTNAFVERFVQSIQQECLDRFVIFGETHMDHVCQEYLEYYHTERPHQGKGIENELLNRQKKCGRPRNKQPANEVLPLNEVRCSERLGGLLKSYWRKVG
jgi:putative transposase